MDKKVQDAIEAKIDKLIKYEKRCFLNSNEIGKIFGGYISALQDMNLISGKEHTILSNDFYAKIL